MSLRFTVIGDPAPQGSKRHVGHGVMVESSKKVKPWRQSVEAAAVAAKNGASALDGPLVLSIVFWLPKPTSLSKKKLALGPCRKPDLSKLIRSTEDALVTAGAIVDDARIVDLYVQKRYVLETGHTGADIVVTVKGAA